MLANPLFELLDRRTMLSLPPCREDAVSLGLTLASLRLAGLLSLVLGCALLATGPAWAILLPLNVSERSSAEEETSRSGGEACCARTPARRLAPRLAEEQTALAYVSIVRGLSPALQPESTRFLVRIDLDVRIGPGAPLRC